MMIIIEHPSIKTHTYPFSWNNKPCMATDPAEWSFVTKHAAMNITRFKKKKKRLLCTSNSLDYDTVPRMGPLERHTKILHLISKSIARAMQKNALTSMTQSVLYPISTPSVPHNPIL
jgi:hypothetical protein